MARTPERRDRAESPNSEPNIGDVARTIASKVPELSRLDPEGRERAVRELFEVQVGFSGPLPPPEMLARYNEIIPNGAERLLALVESDLAHIHRVQRDTLVLQSAIEDRARLTIQCEQTYRMSGLLAGVFALAAALMLTAYLAFLGHVGLAGLIGGTTLVGLVGTFVYGRKSAEVQSRPPPPTKPKKR